MGKVFSWSQIKNRQIPRTSDFAVITAQLKKDLESCDGIIAGTLFGSVVSRNDSRRSDIDCLVVYDPIKSTEVSRTLQKISQAAIECYVPVEIIPIDRDVASCALHSIGPSLGVHLQCAIQNGGLIKKNPLPFLDFSCSSDTEDVQNYLRHKLQKLEKGVASLPSMETATLYLFLQKLLEAPVHVARKMLWWQRIDAPDDTKRTIKRYYPDIASVHEYALFSKITSLDEQYTEELTRQEHDLNKDRYLTMIDTIEDLARDTLKFVKLNALRLG